MDMNDERQTLEALPEGREWQCKSNVGWTYQLVQIMQKTAEP